MVEGRKEQMIDYKLFEGGYCHQISKVALQDERLTKMKFPAIFALLKHPTKGYILFDTGYATRFFKETKRFPFSIYAAITPVFLEEHENAIQQLAKLGIRPDDITYVFISHFHADHTAGLKDFKNSTFICSRKGYESVKNKKGIAALKVAHIPSFLPKDFESRVHFIEDSSVVKNGEINSLEVESLRDTYELVYDIFGDGALLSVDVSGHAAGQFGLFFKAMGGHYVFLVADAVWRSRSYREKIYPLFMARIIMSNANEYFYNFDKLHAFYKKTPNVSIIPSHCEEVISEEMKNKII